MGLRQAASERAGLRVELSGTPSGNSTHDALLAAHLGHASNRAKNWPPRAESVPKQISQDIKRRSTACHFAVDLVTGKVAGFYTLAACIPLGNLPEDIVKRLPRLGRLAVDQQGVGVVGPGFFSRTVDPA